MFLLFYHTYQNKKQIKKPLILHIPQLAGTRFPVPNCSFELCTVPIDAAFSLSMNGELASIYILSPDLVL